MPRPLNPRPNPSDLRRADEERERQEREERALKIWKDAKLWRRRHPDAWCFMVSTAKREATEGRRFSVQWLSEQVRKRDFASFSTPYPILDNSIRPALARMIVDENPEVRRWIEMRRSILDELEVPGVPKRRKPAETGKTYAA